MAIDTGFMGPNYSISTACATANYAFVAAATHIRKGEADVMLAGGSEAPIIPVGLGGFVACRCVLPGVSALCMYGHRVSAFHAVVALLLQTGLAKQHPPAFRQDDSPVERI